MQIYVGVLLYFLLKAGTFNVPEAFRRDTMTEKLIAGFLTLEIWKGEGWAVRQIYQF